MSQLHKTIKNAFLFPLLALALFGVNSARAELKFERTLIEDTIAPDVKSYPFEFAFKNEGDSSVEISEIKTTCGCTTAKLDKMTYAPGESGVIKGDFSVGSRQGLQSKKVRVLTKDLAQPEIQLALKLDILQLVTMKPGLLLWRVGSEPAAKTLTITPNAGLGASVVSVECESADFVVEALPAVAGSNDVEVVVAPLKTEASGRGLVKVTVAMADAEPKIIYAHALIR
ncbi:DUF1573 domain-containing protein [Coraliomargarita sp. SDUM461003]|uniref:DUF1573 domain-containing protein n=1 Tax=Thalassobacterium maritimum TaxID=3041265 RepID=A0ABU1AXY0_9BACT|nr:DUF1573 domain-containing protein [Coraliomargarita sp. SDUM461003]MDQ8209029.1 DUF1573 domain-containing protein [Coraliomargarita sp. SDUM461003]